jgi:hypothetical protein
MREAQGGFFLILILILIFISFLHPFVKRD